MILSFLKRERERTVNVFHYSFQRVQRFSPFRDLFKTRIAHKRALTVVKRWETIRTGQELLETVRDIEPSKRKNHCIALVGYYLIEMLNVRHNRFINGLIRSFIGLNRSSPKALSMGIPRLRLINLGYSVKPIVTKHLTTYPSVHFR